MNCQLIYVITMNYYCIHAMSNTKLVIVTGPVDIDLPSVQVLPIDNFIEGNNLSFNQSKYFGSIILALINLQPIVIPNVEKYMSKRGNLTLVETVGHTLKRMKINLHVEILCKADDAINKKVIAALDSYAAKTNEFSYSVCDTYEIDWFATQINKDCLTCATTSGLDVTFTINGAHYKRHITYQYGAAISKLLGEPELPLPSDLVGDLVSISSDGKFAGYIIDLPTISEADVPLHITVDTKIKAKLSGPLLTMLHNGTNSCELQSIDLESKTNSIITIEATGTKIPITVIGRYAYAVTY
jgi:hypothetical protein